MRAAGMVHRRAIGGGAVSAATRDFRISMRLTADLVDAALFDVVASTWKEMEERVDLAREREGYPKVLVAKRSKTYYKLDRDEIDGIVVGFSECSEDDEWHQVQLGLHVVAAKS